MVGFLNAQQLALVVELGKLRVPLLPSFSAHPSMGVRQSVTEGAKIRRRRRRSARSNYEELGLGKSGHLRREDRKRCPRDGFGFT